VVAAMLRTVRRCGSEMSRCETTRTAVVERYEMEVDVDADADDDTVCAWPGGWDARAEGGGWEGTK
jgi:hypothetical protein